MVIMCSYEITWVPSSDDVNRGRKHRQKMTYSMSVATVTWVVWVNDDCGVYLVVTSSSNWSQCRCIEIAADSDLNSNPWQCSARHCATWTACSLQMNQCTSLFSSAIVHIYTITNQHKFSQCNPFCRLTFQSIFTSLHSQLIFPMLAYYIWYWYSIL